MEHGCGGIQIVFSALDLGAIWCPKVKLSHRPNQPSEVLSQLQSLLLLGQGRQITLHCQSVLHMHLQLISYPISVTESHKILSQFVIGRLSRLVINHMLLLGLISFENPLPILIHRVGSLHREITCDLIDLLSGLLRYS